MVQSEPICSEPSMYSDGHIWIVSNLTKLCIIWFIVLSEANSSLHPPPSWSQTFGAIGLGVVRSTAIEYKIILKKEQHTVAETCLTHLQRPPNLPSVLTSQGFLSSSDNSYVYRTSSRDSFHILPSRLLLATPAAAGSKKSHIAGPFSPRILYHK